MYIVAFSPIGYFCGMELVMETMMIDRDLQLAALEPVPFPEGVAGAFVTLGNLFPEVQRLKYGLSRPDVSGQIIYQAAVGLHPDEVHPDGLHKVILHSGKYAYFDIPDFMNHISYIGDAFKELTSRDDIDPEGYCIEWYTGTRDVRCMVRLKD